MQLHDAGSDAFVRQFNIANRLFKVLIIIFTYINNVRVYLITMLKSVNVHVQCSCRHAYLYSWHLGSSCDCANHMITSLCWSITAPSCTVKICLVFFCFVWAPILTNSRYLYLKCTPRSKIPPVEFVHCQFLLKQWKLYPQKASFRPHVTSGCCINRGNLQISHKVHAVWWMSGHVE